MTRTRPRLMPAERTGLASRRAEGRTTSGRRASGRGHVRTWVRRDVARPPLRPVRARPKAGNAHLALAAAAELRQLGLADALSLVLLICDDDPQRYDRAAVRWLARYAAQDRAMRLVEAARARRSARWRRPAPPVAVLRLERWPRARGHEDEADRVAASAQGTDPSALAGGHIQKIRRVQRSSSVITRTDAPLDDRARRPEALAVRVGPRRERLLGSPGQEAGG